MDGMTSPRVTQWALTTRSWRLTCPALMVAVLAGNSAMAERAKAQAVASLPGLEGVI